METLVGKQHFFERLGATAAVKKIIRHGDTPLVNTPHSRRMVTLVDFEWADLVDQQDKIRLLINPESEYAINASWALQRAYDGEVIFAFDGDVKTGETGSTTVTFANDNPAGDLDFSSAALTTPNLLNVKRKLDEKEVPPGDRFIIVSPPALEQLLKASTAPIAASSDYNTIKALVNGDLDTWVGFKWVVSTLLPSPASNMRYCFAWHKNSMGVAMGKDITVDIGIRRDKSNSTQVYVMGTYGATRVQGEGVVRFKIDETK